MQTSDVRRYLGKYRAKMREIRILDEQIQQITFIKGQRYDTVRVQGTHENSTEEMIVRLIEAEDKLAKARAEAADALLRITKGIDRIENPLVHRVMIEHFIEGMSRREIAELENYSEGYITNVITRGLKKLKNVERTML